MPTVKRVFSLQSSVFGKTTKILLVLFIFCNLAFIVSPIPVFAQQDLNSTNFNYLVNGQATIEGSVFQAIDCSISGVSPLYKCGGFQANKVSPSLPGSGTSSDASPQEPAKLVLYDQLPNGGAIGAASNLMAGLYNNLPVSSGYYLAHIGEQFGVKSAYAQQTNVQGSGEGIIAPVLNLWQVTRNIAYLAFMLVIIVIGFMIMFRQKINPQTVVTIQQAIPNIIIGLALVTFSYFIAALVIDFTFLGTNIVAQVFIQAGGNRFGGAPEINNLAQNANIFQLFATAGLNGGALGAVAGGTFDQFSQTIGVQTTSVIGIVAVVAGFLTINLPLIIGGIGAAAAPVLIPGLLIVVLLIALFIQMARLAFSLIISYIQLLVLTVTGPFLLLAGSIPGRGGTTSFWLRGLIANTLVFPAVFAAFLFAGLILGNTTGGRATLPLFGGASPDFIKVLIAYGILLGSPAIPDMVRQAFKWQGPGAIVGAATGGFLAGAGVANAGRAQGFARLWRGGAEAGEMGTGPLAQRFYTGVGQRFNRRP